MSTSPLRRAVRPGVILPLLCLLYVLLSITTATTTAPLPNEAWFFSPAENLIRHGYMGTTNLVTQGTWMEGIEQRTYWVPPLHILAQAAWYWMVGAGLMQMRALSIAWGVLALVMAFRIGVRLGLGRFAALSGVALLATDFRWVLSGSMGRMDMMCAALGLAGIAAYLELRGGSLPAATVAAHALIAASCLTHPCGVVHGAALVVITLCLDRGRLNFGLIALATLPYCAALTAWGVYISRDPDGFLRQFRGNISGLASEAGRSTRFSGLLHPWDAFTSEIYSRYFAQFGTWGGGRVFGGLQMYVLGLYAAAIGAALFHRRLRATAAGRAMTAASVAVFCSFWLLDGSKASNYLPHVLPWLLLLAAFGLRRLAGGQTGLVGLLLAVAVAGEAAAFAGWVGKNTLQNETVAAVRYVQTHASAGEAIDGGAEYGFFADAPMTFTDDPRLGFLTGRRPDWILLSGWYGTWIEAMRKRDAAFDHYVAKLVDRDSREVFHAGRIKIYRVSSSEPPVLH
ncbi:MAG: hypothetical protein ABI972_19480 [Acidobacteriota bacterium]